MRARIPLLPVVAIGFCCAGLVTAFAGLRAVTGSGSTAKLWLVLFVAAAIAALVCLRFARDDRGRVRLGVGWAVFGAIVVATTIARTPAPGAGAPIGAGWAVLVAGGAAVLLGGIALAISPLVRGRAHPAIVVAAVVAVIGVQVGGYAGAVGWTNGQNVHLTVADAAPLRRHESALDGGVAWHGRASETAVASAGGLVTTSGNALEMLDPVTGKPRWSYRRADVSQVITAVVSQDGRLVGATAVAPGLNPKPTPQAATQRLVVLDAMTGAVITDTPLPQDFGGELIEISRSQAFFSTTLDGVRWVQVAAVGLTGAKAGRPEWAYYPKDGCDLTAFSALSSEIAASSGCGTVDMLNPDTGKPVWEYQAPMRGGQLWPLAGSPAGTVEAVIGSKPITDPAGLGVSAPTGIVALDARTGAVRWQDTVPTAPFAPDDYDSGTGLMTTFWAGDTAVVAYSLQATQRLWLIGYRRGATPSTWSTIVPGVTYNVQFPATNQLGQYVAATPDGRIVVPTQRIEDAADLDAHPIVIVVDGRSGHVSPGVAVGGNHGIPDSTGFFAAPQTLVTPGGTMLAIAGLSGGRTQALLLIGLH